MSPRDGRRRVLSREERTLWAAVTKAIEPLNAVAQATSGEGIAAHVDAAKPQKRAAVKPSPPPPAVPPPLAPLGRRLKQRVARGKQTIDARLDLHGLTQSEAHAVLLRFLRNAHARDARLVLVITGKGVRGEGERGVLKRQVPHWLGLPEFRAYVVGFEDAHVAHGGEGALYVRVRRARRA